MLQEKTMRAWLLALCATASVACGGSQHPEDDDRPELERIGHRAPEFALQAVDGSHLDLASLRGKIVILHFGAGWCPFCYTEAPHLIELQHRYRDRGVQVVIVDVEEPEPDVRAYATRAHFDVPVLLDLRGEVATRYAPRRLAFAEVPRDQQVIGSILVIDRAGIVRYFSLIDSATFNAQLPVVKARLDQLLAEDVD
jgi:peroxiredoxin